MTVRLTTAVASPAAKLGISQNAIPVVVALIDCLVLILIGKMVYEAYTTWFDSSWADTRSVIYGLIIAINTLATVAMLYICDLYTLHAITHPRRQIRAIWYACVSTIVVLLVLAFGLKISAEFSRGWAFFWCLGNPLAICISRFALSEVLKGGSFKNKLTKNIAIVGGGLQGFRMAELASNNGEDACVRITGIYDERSTRFAHEAGTSFKTGTLNDLIATTRRGEVDEIIVALPWAAEQRVMEILSRLETLPVSIRLCPDLVGLNFLHHSFSQCNGVPVLNVSEKPLSDWDNVLKTSFDVMVASLLLIALFPLMLVIAVSVKLTSPGKVFFMQKRIGFNNNLIEVIKFRTLYSNQQDHSGGKLVSRGDTRVTAVGRFLRRTSLDELPQLFNVLKGEMSLVGPRPHPVEARAAGDLYEQVVSEYSIRHKVRPGITGWAQINGWRGETDTVEKIRGRVEHDLYYINHWSMIADIKIILKTIPVMVVGTSAY